MFNPLFFRISLLTTLVSCTMFAQTSRIVYPLQVGNFWQYREPPPPYDTLSAEWRVIGDTLMPNGMTYRVLRSNNYGSRQPLAFRYYRQSLTKLYEYLVYADTSYGRFEIVRYDFAKPVGDTIAVFPVLFGDTAIVKVIDTGTVSIFGKTRYYKTFEETRAQSSTYSVETIADSVGMIFNLYEPGVQLYLSGAIIDGTEYGSITDMRSAALVSTHKYLLAQNYPNPFNPATTILYVLPSKSYVKLTVYNTLGQQVIRLIDEQQEAGYHQFKFDASTLSSGLYFYQLQAGDFLRTMKLLLVR